MTTIHYFLINTPIWVYILFAYLMFIGYKSSKARVVSLLKLCIAPVIFTWMSLHSMFTELHGVYWHSLIWVLGLIIGSTIGWLLAIRLKPQVDKKRLLVRTEGSWLMMVLIILIFAYKYYLGFVTAVHPEIISHPGFLWCSLILLGAITGMFVGRVLYYGRCMMVMPSVDLKES